MTAIRTFLKQAHRDEPVFINAVRDAFAREGTHAVVCRFTLYDGSVRDFTLRFPAFTSPEETAFAASYLHATLYNILSVLGARNANIFVDDSRKDLLSLEGIESNRRRADNADFRLAVEKVAQRFLQHVNNTLAIAIENFRNFKQGVPIRSLAP